LTAAPAPPERTRLTLGRDHDVGDDVMVAAAAVRFPEVADLRDQESGA
jgi:hypothetical protein